MTVIRGNTLTSKELGEQFRDKLKERHEHPEKWRGLQFGHTDLDKLTGGVRKGEFVVIAGAQKSGKTSIALSWAQHFSKQVQPGEQVLFVSLEMGHDALAGRVLANLSTIEVSKFRDYNLASYDWEKVDKGVEKLSELPVLWNVGAYNIEGIESIVKEYGDSIRVIIVDYFQLMYGSGFSNKRYEQLEDISRRLKRLTLNNELSVVAISQQSREALKSVKKQKDPNTMAGTQALARDCDLLITLLPYIEDGEEIPHLRNLYVALSRNSGSDVTLPAFFSGAYCRFGALAEDELSEMPEPPWDWINK
jgi:replicative DNA helicase